MKIANNNRTPSRGQKCKFPAMALGLSLAMAATSWAQVGTVDWDNISDGGTTVVDYAESIGRMEIFGGSTLLIETGAAIGQSTSQDSYLGGAAGETGSGTFIQTGGDFVHGDDLKCTDGGPATYKMQGGSSTIPGYLETDGNCLFEFSGGSFVCSVEDGENLRDSGATFRVIGNGASLIQFYNIQGNAAIFEFVPNAAGLITPITSGSTQAQSLNVDLAALTAPATMTLFTGGAVAPFPTVTITQGATTLTPGTAGSLGLNEYALDYLSGTGLALEVNVSAAPSTLAITSITVDAGIATITMTGEASTTYVCKSSTTLSGFSDVLTVPSPLTTDVNGDRTFTVDAADAERFYLVEDVVEE